MTTPEIKIAKLEQAQKDMGRRFDDAEKRDVEILRQLTNHIPHQINALSDKFDRRFDLQAGSIEAVKNFSEALDRRMLADQSNQNEMKLATKIVIAVCGMILLAFLNNLLASVFNRAKN